MFWLNDMSEATARNGVGTASGKAAEKGIKRDKRKNNKNKNINST